MRVILLVEDPSWFDADPETALIQVSHYMTFTPGCSSKHDMQVTGAGVQSAVKLGRIMITLGMSG